MSGLEERGLLVWFNTIYCSYGAQERGAEKHSAIKGSAGVQNEVEFYILWLWKMSIHEIPITIVENG